MRFIHLSDIHIGKSKNHEKFSTITQWLLTKTTTHKAKVVLITGDIVDDGALWQYKEAEKQITKLVDGGFKVLCIPGNHDYGPNGIIENNECIGYFRKYLSGDVDYPHCEVIDDYAFVLLDSMLEEMRETEFWGAQGKLGENQLRNLDRVLDEIKNNSPEKKVVIAMHHHPFYYNYFLKLRDDELFKKVITNEVEETSRVNCLVFGHKHVEKRFNDPKDNKEEKYHIDLIFASGSSTERHSNGKMLIPNIDLSKSKIIHHQIT